MRVHVLLPGDLVEEVDRLVGCRGRSQFFAEAVREKVARIKLIAAAHKAAGSLADVHIPAWEGAEAASAWVWASREADERRLYKLEDE